MFWTGDGVMENTEAIVHTALYLCITIIFGLYGKDEGNWLVVFGNPSP